MLLRRGPSVVALFATLPVAALALSLFAGRYPVPPGTVVHVLTGGLIGPAPAPADAPVVHAVIFTQRLPRALLALLTGAGMGLSGAAYQGIFRNPLVSQDVLGVTQGTAFGVVLGILLFGLSPAAQLLGIAVGLGSMALIMAMSRTRAGDPRLVLILAGVIASALWSALIALVKYVADPNDELPAITYWLMGSLSAASYGDVARVGTALALGGAVLLGLRWRLNVLSLGDEEARALGVPATVLRWLVIAAVTVMVSAEVAATGVIGWVGLIVPHIGRMLVGPEHGRLLPAAMILGGSFMLVVDVLARTLTAAEIPLGILTAMLGAPLFLALLQRTGGGWR
ncbi:MAG TPA: iron ABC transporter permease [Thermaerobacter sp.]